MDYPAIFKVKVMLSDDELQLPALDELCNKFREWAVVAQEAESGRKTRSALKRSDVLYEDILRFKLPPIQLKKDLSPTARWAPTGAQHNERTSNSVETSSLETDSDSSSFRPITRSLRSRSNLSSSGTHSQASNSNNNNHHNHHQNTQRQQLSRQPNAPSTPQNQRIRAHMRNPTSGASSDGATSVLKAALNQQHPSVSVNKLRQILRADSVQKKKQEEKERQEKLLMERKLKEERAEAQKKQLLDEKAMNTRMNREQRLFRARELRKAREAKAKEIKAREETLRQRDMKKALAAAQQQQQVADHQPEPEPTYKQQHQPEPEPEPVRQETPTKSKKTDQQREADSFKQPPPQPQLSHQPIPKLNETFKKPADDCDNIDISIQDETTEETREKIQKVAVWTRAPHLRDALILQFSKSDGERYREVRKIFPTVTLPVELERIFGPNKINNRYLCRTSSAVWSPPNRAMKRSSSMLNYTPQGKQG